uniref:Uncharacterized protein n=1 Tax=Panagrolaimus sp. JU765 TaxID=591449 RepID=A0AC34R5P5_9BILA
MIFSIGIGLIATFGAVFPDPPIIILILSLFLAILIKFLSNLLEMLKSRFSKKFEVTSKDSVLLVVNGIVVSLASVLIPWILAPFAFLFFSNKNDNSSTKVFKLLFVIFMSIPGSIFAVDLIKHGSAYEFPSAMFVNSSLFLWLGCLSFGIYKKFTYLLVTMAFYRLFAGDLDYVYYVQSVEAQCYLTSIVYLLFLVVKN